jgi:hypothetical protein
VGTAAATRATISGCSTPASLAWNTIATSLPVARYGVAAGERHAGDQLRAEQTCQVAHRESELLLVALLRSRLARRIAQRGQHGRALRVGLVSHVDQGLEAGEEHGVLIGGDERRQRIERGRQAGDGRRPVVRRHRDALEVVHLARQIAGVLRRGRQHAVELQVLGDGAAAGEQREGVVHVARRGSPGELTDAVRVRRRPVASRLLRESQRTVTPPGRAGQPGVQQRDVVVARAFEKRLSRPGREGGPPAA